MHGSAERLKTRTAKPERSDMRDARSAKGGGWRPEKGHSRWSAGREPESRTPERRSVQRDARSAREGDGRGRQGC